LNWYNCQEACYSPEKAGVSWTYYNRTRQGQESHDYIEQERRIEYAEEDYILYTNTQSRTTQNRTTGLHRTRLHRAGLHRAGLHIAELH